MTFHKKLFYIFFFLSGAVSLTLQVAWVKALSLFFGADAYSASITLSVFMGGLALGSYLASGFAERSPRPLALYGLCEILIALSAYMVPIILAAFQNEYREVYNASFESSKTVSYLFKTGIAIAALLVPTALMGATLPLVVRAFSRDVNEVGRQAGTFYAYNTIGALTGTIVAGFILLPGLGTDTTVTLIVGVGLTVGTGSILVDAFGSFHRLTPLSDIPTPPRPDAGSRRRVILITAALSGLAALALEVVWMRVLVQSFSGTVYAFSIMLASFLFGIYYGSMTAAKYVDTSADPVDTLIRLQFGLGLSIAIVAVVSYAVPTLFGILVWGGTTLTGGAFATVSVVAQFIVAGLLILAPTLLLGATYPYAVRAYTGPVEGVAVGTGRVLAANTAGSVAGALLGGFVILPLAGARDGMLTIALIFVLNGAILVITQRAHNQAFTWKKPVYTAMLSATAVFILLATILPRQTVVNYNLQQSTTPDVVYHGDGVTNSIDIVRSGDGNTIMMINGNIESDTTFIQRRHFILKGHLPLLLHADPSDVAVVGLGLGITLAATTNHPGVENIQLIELSPEMLDAHEYLRNVTDDVLSNPLVDILIDDGRNFMTMSDETFDVITADPVHPRISGIGYLYTKEYYKTILSRLRPGGIVVQWLPMYNISPTSFDAAFRTFTEVFPHATFWYVRGHGLLVATDVPLSVDCRTLMADFSTPAVKSDLASIDIDSPEELMGFLLMDEAHIAKYLRRNFDRQIVTDDNAYLEYQTPFEFMGRTESIVPDLIDHAGWDEDRIFGAACDPEFRDKARSFFESRLFSIVPELSEPIR